MYTFGENVNRDPRGQVISVAYFALVNPSKLELKADTDALDAKWFSFTQLPKLAYGPWKNDTNGQDEAGKSPAIPTDRI